MFFNLKYSSWCILNFFHEEKEDMLRGVEYSRPIVLLLFVSAAKLLTFVGLNIGNSKLDPLLFEGFVRTHFYDQPRSM